MQITQGDFSKGRATVKMFGEGAPAIQIKNGPSLNIDNDIQSLEIKNTETKSNTGMMLLILLLGITIVGLIIAIPLMLIMKKDQVASATIQFMDNDGNKATATVDEAEYKFLSKHLK